MKLNAVAVTTKDIKKSIEFYSLLGFVFPKFEDGEVHVESIQQEGVRLMIDSEEVIKGIIGANPMPGNHSSFALEFDSPKEVDESVAKISIHGFAVIKEPWDAFWGQRYAVVKDPNGYMVDLYAKL